MALTLQAETWGSTYMRAYRQSRNHFGQSQITWDKLAERLRQVIPECSDTALLRLGDLEFEPERPAQRLRAFLGLLAMGYDPEDFGMSPDNVPLGAIDLKRAKRLLSPRAHSPRNPRDTQPLRLDASLVGAGAA